MHPQSRAVVTCAHLQRRHLIRGQLVLLQERVHQARASLADRQVTRDALRLGQHLRR